MVIHSGIHVFINNRKIQLQSPRITGAELLRKAGFSEAEHWNLYRLQNEADRSGGVIVYCDDTLSLKDGDWFRAAEGHQSCK
jgi:hypothetical protein